MTLKSFYDKKRRVPGETILKEEIRYLLNSREYINTISKDDEKEILRIIKKIYSSPPKDGDELLEKCIEFARFVNLKQTIEGVDLQDFNQYDGFSRKVQTSISIGSKEKDNPGSFLIKDINDRQFHRQDFNPVSPTPFHQINNLTNAGGYVNGSIIVILDKPKQFKTGMLINVARGYLKMKKKVLYIDLENGEDEIQIRLEQSIAKKTKKEILSGDHDDKTQKTLRKYKRLGAELVVKRFPAKATTAFDIQNYMDFLYREHGIRFDELLIDYMGLLGSTSGKTDDHDRISDVYIDIANLASNPNNSIEHVWTAHHIKRDAYKREETVYEGNDIAKCIDIVRHAQAIFGLNRNEHDLENDVFRMEVVEQRDGKPYGRALFNIDIDCQFAKEFTPTQRKNWLGDYETKDEANEGDSETRKGNRLISDI